MYCYIICRFLLSCDDNQSLVAICFIGNKYTNRRTPKIGTSGGVRLLFGDDYIIKGQYMNIPLYYSSALMGALILLASLISYSAELAVLYQITYIGIITSILNHMSNSDIAKYTDRITIVLASFVYIYYTFFIKSKPIQILVFTLLAISISCFFFSKLDIARTQEVGTTGSVRDLSGDGLSSKDKALSFDNTRTTDIYLPYRVTPKSQLLHMSAHFLAVFIFIMIVYDYSFRDKS